MERFGAAVVGGGAVGTAVAWQLAEAGVPDVVLLERNPRLGEEQSGRSSGVVHAGIYYAKGSLKARLCVEANARLPELCRAHNRRRVLIDITGMDGDIPQLDRFLLGKRVGRLWGRRVKVAILTHPERITRFFENVANNDGANVQVFGDVESARRWLLARQLLDAPER